ncbi:hypothetical protein YC2023_117033 [Brassica napus]
MNSNGGSDMHRSKETMNANCCLLENDKETRVKLLGDDFPMWHPGGSPRYSSRISPGSNKRDTCRLLKTRISYVSAYVDSLRGKQTQLYL